MNRKGNLKTKLAAVFSAGVLAVTGTASAVSGMTVSAQPSAGTYGDALKLSLYFFDANQCGADDNVLTWRGKCHTYDAEASLSSAKGLSSSSMAAIKAANGGSDTVDVSGGYHDAGDHLKFSNTMGYSCTNLAWSYFENPNSYKETGSEDHLLYILKKMCDYFMKVTYLDDSGNVIAFCYMVGDDQDHNIWTAPEVQTQNRPTYWADASNPSVDASGHMAAALAATSLAFRDKNADYADACLKYANALEKFTEKYPKATYEGIGSYYSCGNIEDKVAWSDLWCAIANNNGKLPDSYQAQYTPSNGVYNGSIYDYWVYSWDKVWGGYSALLYSMDPQKYSAHGSELVFDMDQLVGNKNQAYYPVGGGWGASRYNCAWQMYALTYAKYTSGQDKYNEYAQGQMDYLLGNNPANRSYLIGFGDSYPQHIRIRVLRNTLCMVHWSAVRQMPTVLMTITRTLIPAQNRRWITMAALHWQLPDCMPFTAVRQQLHRVQLHLLLKSTATLYSAMAAARLLSPAQPRPRSRPRPQQKRQQRQQKLPQQRTLPRHRIRWQRGKRYRIL